MRTSQMRRINCLLIKTKVFGTISIQLKPFRIEETQDKILIGICQYVVIVYNVVMSI